LNILIVSPFLPYPLDNGGAMRIYHLARHLAARHRVALLSYGILTDDAARALSFCESVTVAPAPEFPRPWREHLRALPGPLPASVCYPIGPLVERLQSVLRRSHFDVIEVEFLGIAHVVHAFGAGPRRILVNHLITSESRSRQLRLMPWGVKRFYYGMDLLKLRRYERRVLSAFDGCVTVSARDAARIASWAPGVPVAAVANGVDTDAFRPQGTEAPDSLIFIGSFDRDQVNADAAIYLARAVLPLIRRYIPNARLTVVGSNPPAAVRDLARFPGITVTGRVDDVRPHLSRASVMVLPLRGGAGTKIRVYTAMAMQKPIVATSVAAEGLEAAPGREIVIADGLQAFADEVVSLLNDRERRQRIGRAARARAVAEYDWRISAGRLEEFLQTLTAETRRQAPGAVVAEAGRGAGPLDLVTSRAKR